MNKLWWSNNDIRSGSGSGVKLISALFTPVN